MNNFIVTLFCIGTILSSCGSKAEEKGPSVCDCIKMQDEIIQKVDEAGDDDHKITEIEQSYKERLLECKKIGEGKSKEEKARIMEEAKKCK